MNGTEERIQFVIGSKAAEEAIFASFSYRWKGMTTGLAARFSSRKWNKRVPFAQSVIGEEQADPRNGGFLGANKAFAYPGGGSFTCFR